MTKPNITYFNYIKIKELTSLQEPLSDKAGRDAHDEMFFILFHQTYELWFKQIIFELDSVIGMFGGNFVDESNIGVAVTRLERIVSIEKLLIDQVAVLETMTPLDFLDFRDLFGGASGAQSSQYRLIENKLGLKPAARVLYNNMPYFAEFHPDEIAAVQKSERDPSLFDVIEKWLERTPFLNVGGYDFLKNYSQAYIRSIESEHEAIAANKTLSEEYRATRKAALLQTREYVESICDEKRYAELPRKAKRFFSHRAFLAALFINLYRDQPILHLPFRLLNTLVEIDEYLGMWRYRHAVMTLRMLGSKMGSAASSGYDYLQSTVERHRIYADLFSIATLLLPRSKIPELAAEIKRELGFFYSSK